MAARKMISGKAHVAEADAIGQCRSASEGDEMLLAIGIVLVLMIFHTAWLEQRIRALERRWNESLDQQIPYGLSPQASRKSR
ncbi:MAG TPA: hypothetical protein VFT65_20840 [Candidatus Angelobacter sp.]|nr:hypothetical protein [Candidatus Angelobacter sp.]